MAYSTSKQTPTEQAVSKMLDKVFGENLTDKNMLSEIKIVPATPSSEDIIINRTNIIMLPLTMIILLKRKYAEIKNEIKRILPSTKVYFVRNVNVNDTVLKGITEDICFPALLKGISTDYPAVGVEKRKVLVEKFETTNEDVMKEMEVVYETVVGDKCNFELANF